MLPALQSGSGIIASDLMRSMLEEAEARRQEREDKLKGVKKDEAAEQKIRHDPVTAAANEKINAFFFEGLKQEANPMAALIGRVASALGLTQGNEESGFSFARRLRDAVTFMEMVPKTGLFDKPTEVSASYLNLDVSNIIAEMNGTVEEEGFKPNGKAAFIAKLATQGGLSTKDPAVFDDQLTTYLTSMRAGLPEGIKELEEMTGLKDLGISIDELIDAVANPYGDAAQKIKGILDDKKELEKGMTLEMNKVIQRLEDVADPKTLEELKQEKENPEFTEVNDAEVQAERDADIENLKHAEKLDDVIEMHDAIRDGLEQAKDGEGGEEVVNADAAAAAQMIQLLSAGLTVDKATEADNDNEADADADVAEDEPSKSSPSKDGKPDADKQEADFTNALSAVNGDTVDAPLWVGVDENGLYELLKRNAA